MNMDKQLNDTASLKVRNTNIEVFRLLLMLSIFCWHILMHGAGLKNMSDGYVNDFVYKAFLCAFFAPATYCFMFVSGFFGIKFSLSKLAKLELSLIIVSLLCSIIVYFLGRLSENPQHPKCLLIFLLLTLYLWFSRNIFVTLQLSNIYRL